MRMISASIFMLASAVFFLAVQTAVRQDELSLIGVGASLILGIFGVTEYIVSLVERVRKGGKKRG